MAQIDSFGGFHFTFELPPQRSIQRLSRRGPPFIAKNDRSIATDLANLP